MRIQNTITAILLIASLLFVIGTPSILVGWFKLDQERIAQTLCVKRSEAKNTCQGQCHMNKVLKKTENAADKSTSQERERIEVKEIQMISQQVDEFAATPVAFTIPTESPAKVLEGFHKVLLRPPITA